MYIFHQFPIGRFSHLHLVYYSHISKYFYFEYSFFFLHIMDINNVSLYLQKWRHQHLRLLCTNVMHRDSQANILIGHRHLNWGLKDQWKTNTYLPLLFDKWKLHNYSDEKCLHNDDLFKKMHRLRDPIIYVRIVSYWPPRNTVSHWYRPAECKNGLVRHSVSLI